MSSYEQSVTLLRASKQAQVKALISLGLLPSGTDASTIKASLFADYIKWAGGILDITLATVKKTTNQRAYFTKSEWDAVTDQSNYLTLGLRVRAYCKDFIIASQDYPVNASIAWGTAAATPNVISAITQGLYADFEAKSNTRAMAAASTDLAGNIALAYSVNDGNGYTDSSEWSVPSFGFLLIISKIKVQINAALVEFGWTNALCQIQSLTYWSSTEYGSDKTQAWYFSFSNSVYSVSTKTSQYRIRLISVN